MKMRKIYYGIPVLILAVIVVGFLAIAPANSMTMDVNPSIELVTSRLDRVVEINPLNEDGEDLLKGFEQKDKNLENTVSDLVDLMISTGHIKGGDDNFVMITVEDDTIESKYVDRVNKTIADMLEKKQIEATVLNQEAAARGEGEKQTGREIAAQKLSDIDSSITLGQLGDMTVRELFNYSRDNNIPIEKLFKVAEGNLEKTKQEKVKESKDMISQKRAEEIALATINGEITKVELDNLDDDDGPDYKIDILAEDGKYELEIDAYTGRVKEYEKEDDKSSSKTKSDRISIDQAKKIALDQVGGGTIVEFESDDDEYEIDIKKDGFEYEIEIDAYTGKIKELEKEKDDDKSSSKKSTSNRISIDQAKKIALDQVGGGTIVEFESDDDEYEIEIKKDGFEYEIEIDAYTGEIKEFEKDD